MTGHTLNNPVINPLHPRYTMANNTLDKAIAAVPKFGDRISLFTKKLRLAQYADNSIYDYRLKIAQAVLFFTIHELRHSTATIHKLPIKPPVQFSDSFQQFIKCQFVTINEVH